MKDFEHIAIIDPGLRVAETDCFNNIASMSNLPCTYHLPAMQGASSLDRENPDLVKGIIVFGGSGSLVENLEWRLKLERWFEKCLDKKVPVLAFCWGHQWIAHLFGGKIGLVPGNEKLKGFREVQVESSSIYEKSNGEIAVAHRAMVLEAPKDTNCFVKSEVVENEGFEYRNYPIHTFQGHPEATLEYLRNNSFDIHGTEDFRFGNNLVRRFVNKGLLGFTNNTQVSEAEASL